jgi:two-component system response regulator RegA
MERPRLLVVDDDHFTRLALNAFFSRGGWQVSLAATVAEAMALLRDGFLCVILDLDLPDGGGEVVLGAVRSSSPGTQVMVCSGVDDPARLAEIRRLTPEVMMSKPIDLGTVYRLRETAALAA